MSGIAAEDIGKCAYGIFKKGDELIGKSVGIAGGHLSGKEMADSLSKVLGEEVDYNKITPELYRSFGFPGADDLGNMFQFYDEFADIFIAARSLDFSRELNPSLKDFNVWLQENVKKMALD
jgi:hypothetical protein